MKVIDSAGWVAELNDSIRYQKVFGFQTERAETDVFYSLNQTSGVLFIRSNPNIYVFGVARMPVERDRVAANHQVADPSLVQRYEEIFEVGVEYHNATGGTLLGSPPAQPIALHKVVYASKPNRSAALRGWSFLLPSATAHFLPWFAPILPFRHLPGVE